MDNSMSPADFAALSNGNGFGGFEGLIYLAVIASMFGGGWGGFGWGGNAGAENLQNYIQNGFNFNDLQDQNRDLMQAVNNGTAQSVAASNQVYHDVVGYVGDKYSELARDIAGVALTQQQCVGDTQRMIADAGASLSAQIAQNKYDNAMGLAGLEMRLTSKMDQNKIEDLQNQVNQLQLAQATNGMLRFPNSWSYGAGPFPPLFGGCNCGCNNV